MKPTNEPLEVIMPIRRRRPNPSVEVASLCYQIAVPDSEPRHILEKIVWQKEDEVEKLRSQVPLLQLIHQVKQLPPPRDFLQALLASERHPALIAEVKKASPSKGIIKADFDPVAIAITYQKAGANCISVLTDEEFFQGSFDYLAAIRQTVDLPLLCKDFLIYPYQIYYARLNGADAVLLIAAILTDKDIQYFLKIAHSLGMTALVEVHTLEEMQRVLAIEGVKLVGINNRNLEDFSVNVATTCEILKASNAHTKGVTIVSESGLYTSKDLTLVSKAGAKAVLIGESIIKQVDIAQAIKELYES